MHLIASDPADLVHERVDLRGGQGHAQQHVREDPVHGGIRQGQGCAGVVQVRFHAVRHCLFPGGAGQLLQGGGAEVGGVHPQSPQGQPQGVAPVSGSQLQHRAGPADGEHLQRAPGGL
ncbi:hypothetical protein A6A08_18720 [Nocardiopsis sp. TSRI0078]|nr:hypothetical protein A6A08_18720 [Nocardiopsis sp. TSRI0078]